MAVQADSTLLREIERTGAEFIAAMAIMARWEEANPWPDGTAGITEAHYEWRRQKDIVDERCGYRRKAELNMAAYRAAREAGLWGGHLKSCPAFTGS